MMDLDRSEARTDHSGKPVPARCRPSPADGPAHGTRATSSGAQLRRQQDRKKRQAEKQDRHKQHAESLVVRLQVQREELMEVFTGRKGRELSSCSEFEP